MENCIFCKIVKGEIPSQIVWQNNDFLIFKDIAPKAKEHYLLISKEHYATFEEMSSVQAAKFAEMLRFLPTLKKDLNLEGGYRLIINQGADAGQTVFHLHVHILGGQKMEWNPA